jgi:hypothetical protein
MNAGSRQSFYVTMNNNTTYILYGGNYTQTTAQQQSQVGTNISIKNNDIVITMGTANVYPFGRVLAPRYFNGAVTYRRRQ